MTQDSSGVPEGGGMETSTSTRTVRTKVGEEVGRASMRWKFRVVHDGKFVPKIYGLFLIKDKGGMESV